MTATWAKLGAERVNYYERGVASGREDYYAGHGEAPGRWAGEGARLLGLAGDLTPGELTRMASGQHPATGEQLRTTAGANQQNRIGAFDFTFSCAKSVSLLYASGDRELSTRILDAHDRAVTESLRVLEAEATFVRRGKGGLVSERADGLTIGRYRHRASRAGDPQLHEHCIVGNQARGPDGRWTALDSVRMRDFKMALGAIHEAEVRANVAELGLRWRPLGANGLTELGCIDPATLRHFSKRRIEIENAVRGEGAAAMAGAAVDTREAKREVDMPAIEREVAAKLGPDLIQTVRGDVGSSTDPSCRPSERLTDGHLDQLAGADGLTRMRNTFSRNDVIVAVARSAPQGMHAPEVMRQTDAFLARADVLELAGGRWTTQDLVDAERARESAQLGRADTRTAVMSDKAVRDGTRGLGLNDEQRGVVEAVAKSGNGVELVQAQAGTGKTYTMSAVSQVAELDGRRVIGCAPTGRAAGELQKLGGIESHTLDSLVRQLDRGDLELGARDVLVLDEAAMTGTRLAARLERHAADAGAKLIEIGDRRQLQSVLAGGELSGAHSALGGLELREVVRQRALEERRILGRLHAGDVKAYVDHQDAAGRVHWSTELEQAVNEYMRHARELGFEQVAFVCPTNAMVTTANDLVRAQLGRTRPFEAGDRVLCRMNDRAVQVVNGDRATITRVHGAGVDVQLDSGVKRSIPRSYIDAGFVQHGYAQTVHTAQGATVDRCVIAARPAEMYAELAYVAASRARDTTDLYVIDSRRVDERAEIGPVSRTIERDQRDELIRAMSESRAEELAMDQDPERVRAGLSLER